MLLLPVLHEEAVVSIVQAQHRVDEQQEREPLPVLLHAACRRLRVQPEDQQVATAWGP